MALRLIRDRPGDPALCDTIAGSKLSPLANLTPASGRRTQSISPYAGCPFVSRAAASIAPCPSFATMAYAPLAGQDGGNNISDFPIWLEIYFRAVRLTHILGDLPVGQDSYMACSVHLEAAHSTVVTETCPWLRDATGPSICPRHICAGSGSIPRRSAIPLPIHSACRSWPVVSNWNLNRPSPSSSARTALANRPCWKASPCSPVSMRLVAAKAIGRSITPTPGR